MADVVFVVVVIIGFFALCAAFVVSCDRIVRSGDDASEPVSSTEMVSRPASRTVVSVIVPCASIACAALVNRFTNTCTNAPG